jgi:GNAT superfamily N-acetyltransferase
MATQFRQLGSDDMETLVVHLVAWHREEGVSLDPAYARRQVRRILGDNFGWHAWLIECGGRAVGYLMLSFRHGGAFDAPGASLAALYVVPGCRHGNIGRQAHRLVSDLGRWLHVRIGECDTSRQDRHVPALSRPAIHRWFESFPRQATA